MYQGGFAYVAAVKVPPDGGGGVAVGKAEHCPRSLAGELWREREGGSRRWIDELHHGVLMLPCSAVLRVMRPVIPLHGGRKGKHSAAVVRARLAVKGGRGQKHRFSLRAVRTGKIA